MRKVVGPPRSIVIGDPSAQAAYVAPAYGTAYMFSNALDAVYEIDTVGGVLVSDSRFTGIGVKRAMCVSEDGSLVYFVTGSSAPYVLYRVNRDGTGAVVLNNTDITITKVTMDLVVDTAAGYIFSIGPTIIRFNLDGTGATDIESGGNTVTGDLDRGNQHLFFQYNNGNVKRVNYDGTGDVTRSTASANGGGVFVDPAAGRLFVHAASRINRLPLDLSAHVEVVGGLSGSSNPGVSYMHGDPATGRVYALEGAYLKSWAADGTDETIHYAFGAAASGRGLKIAPNA